MRPFQWVSLLTLFSSILSYSQAPGAPDFKLAFAEHSGQLRWRAQGFKTVQISAKPNGKEIGVRAQDATGNVTFLGFLFLVSDQAPLTAAKCRDGAMEIEKKSNPKLKVIESPEIPGPADPPVLVITYTSKLKDGTTLYIVRGFVATGDTCGDLEFYSNKP